MADLAPVPDCADAQPRTIAARIEAAFDRVHRERMHDVPILNPALGIKAVGTREVEAGWLSAIVTPWFINLMLLPRTPEQAQAFCALQLGRSVAHAFPSGHFDFIVGEEGDLGRYQMCSLFSPVLEFESHGAALITAETAIAALFDARLAPDAPEEAATAAPTAPTSEAAEVGPLSRRGLLFGRNPEAEGAAS